MFCCSRYVFRHILPLNVNVYLLVSGVVSAKTLYILHNLDVRALKGQVLWVQRSLIEAGVLKEQQGSIISQRHWEAYMNLFGSAVVHMNAFDSTAAYMNALRST